MVVFQKRAEKKASQRRLVMALLYFSDLLLALFPLKGKAIKNEGAALRDIIATWDLA